MDLVKPVIRAAKKYKTKAQFHARFSYTKYYETLRINEHAVLIESFNGDDITGSPFYLLKELCCNPEYSGLNIYVVAHGRSAEGIEELLNNQVGKSKRYSIVMRHSDEYCKLLASAKYLITNVTFPTYFIKKKGQVYLNTWHGTPLKALGRSMTDKPNSIGNVQRNFLMSDYLLCPSEFVCNCLRTDYMIDIFYQGSYVFAGYPQNERLINQKRLNEIQYDDDFKLSLTGKKVVVYMPTWREKRDDAPADASLTYLKHALLEFEKRLDNDTIVLAKPHHLASSSIDWNGFSKVYPFPSNMETYQVLACADILVTDYSSVMFDFLNAKKPVFLYTYDESEYESTRSLYHKTSELPFWQTDNMIDLCSKINQTSSYEQDYTELRDTLCHYDAPNTTRKLCSLLIKGNQSDLKVIQGERFHNGKDNILIYAGALLKNGITSSLNGLLNSVDLDEANYTLLFYGGATKKNTATINSLPKKVRYIAIQGQQNMTIKESVARYRYFRLNSTSKSVTSTIDRLFDRECERILPTCSFDKVIHFTGYERQLIHILNACKNADKYIFVHNDMASEYKARANFHLNSNLFAYKTWTKIAVVRESLKDSLIESFHIPSDKICVVHNCNDLISIRNGANSPIAFDRETISNTTEEEIKGILDDKTVTTFINVARFSPEKGQQRLIEAFQTYNREIDRNSHLIIVGGHGKEYESISDYVDSNCPKIVTLIQSLSNPYPLIARSNAMILSSYYEGLPMVIFEALALNVPVITTDIPGPSEFLHNEYGLVVDNSTEGILSGLKMFHENRLEKLTHFDVDHFNEMAANEFYELLDE